VAELRHRSEEGQPIRKGARRVRVPADDEGTFDAERREAIEDRGEVRPVADHARGEMGDDDEASRVQLLGELDRRLDPLRRRGRDGDARAGRQERRLFAGVAERDELEGRTAEQPSDRRAPVGGEVNNPSEENSIASDAGSHNFSAEWQADATEHWQICLDPNCTERTNRGMHSGGEATCTEQAICSICGLPYGEALGHDFESYTVDIEPTCTAPGSKSRHCARCGEAADVTAIPATGHSYSSKWTYSAYGHWHTATCGHSVTSGYAPHTGGTVTCTEQAICAVCGRAYGEPLGHDFEPYYTVDINPTCTTPGSKSYHCALCGAKTGVTVIPATGHAFTTA
jgi:hypothetical protein